MTSGFDTENRDGPRQPGDAALPAFDYDPRTRVVFGPRSIEQLGKLAAELKGSRVLLVTDPGIQKAGHTEHGVASLLAAGLDVTVFADVRPDPTTEDVDR